MKVDKKEMELYTFTIDGSRMIKHKDDCDCILVNEVHLRGCTMPWFGIFDSNQGM